MTSRHRLHIAHSTLIVIFLALVGCLGLTTATASASDTTAPYCGITWGSLTKAGGTAAADTVQNVRSGQHDCYDRLVVDLKGGSSVAYSASYVDAVYYDPRGDLVPLDGGARIRIVVHAPSYDPVTGAATYSPGNEAQLVNVAGYQTFRQVAFAGSVEGQTTIGLGVRARLPFRVFVLSDTGGARLVIDVAHHW
jgi:hypothetical protein